MIAYANSLDTVGIFAGAAQNVEHIFDKLNVYDPKDPTSLPPSTRTRLIRSQTSQKALKVGIPLEYNIATLHPLVRRAWSRTLQYLKECGHVLYPVHLPVTQHALSAYYILAPAEASSNLAKYDGVRYGSRADGMDGTPDSVLFARTRGQGFGSEVQRRVLLGAFSLSAQVIDNYFIQAQKIRRLVQQDFDNIFAKPNILRDESSSTAGVEPKVDVLVCPTAPTLAPLLSSVQGQDAVESYMNDIFTVPASLAGLPAISVPVSPSKLDASLVQNEDENSFESVGIQVIGQYGDDALVIECAKMLEKGGISHHYMSK